ncbi:glutathione S-transferase [Roseovarius sp. 2305UL8-3]|uniref:glutathione S-transferase n=1 Tax=Roseovarius conchicola TaxID=3121636 RepID=UPI003528BCC8
MKDYTLTYWPLPFRGQFVRAVLAFGGASWDETSPDEVARMRAAPIADQPVPHMGPPLLHDHEADLWLAQLPAVLGYLGTRFELMPHDPARVALTYKAIGDANDVLDNITRMGGAQMWTRGEWETFMQDRLPRWLQIFEELGTRHGLTAGQGHLLGTGAPGLADLVTATLWGTMTEKLPALRLLLEVEAPTVAGLCERINAHPALVAMRADTDARFGDIYCGGHIEASIREMLA